jgi:hypothetical protein
MSAPATSPGDGGATASDDLTRRVAREMLARERAMAELSGRRFELAVRRADLAAARRWDAKYRLSTFRCRLLAALVRTEATARPRPARAAAAARPRVHSPDITRAEPAADAGLPARRTDPRRRVDELLDRIRRLVSERAILERDGASEFELWANREAISRLQERLATLVARQGGSTPPAA